MVTKVSTLQMSAICTRTKITYEIFRTEESIKGEVFSRDYHVTADGKTIFLAASFEVALPFVVSKLMRCSYCDDNKNLKIYDGALGYEAAYCPRCGYFEDHENVGKSVDYIGR